MLVVLAGGVGAARFLDGLVAAIPPETVCAIVNTGDDLDRYGLTISPDVDIVLYTLAGVVDPEKGWGVAGDTFHCLSALERLGQPAWFRLGDQDLATHLVRTTLLRTGHTPSQVTAHLAEQLGIMSKVIPMTDSHVRTMVETDAGDLTFQEYFVQRGHQDTVRKLHLAGSEDARPAPGAIEAIAEAEAVIVAPSNPFVSIGTILSIPGYREALQATPAPVIAISPIIGGQALKGPADRMLASLGHEATALGVARLYAEFLDVFVLDTIDAALAPQVEKLGLKVLVTNTIMRGPAERKALAEAVLAAAR